MLEITKEDMQTIERQMYNRARDIDVALLNCLIDDSTNDFVLDSLMLYMNKDGGFGSGLQIDNYNPNSSVYQVYEAYKILMMAGFDADCKNPLYQEIMNRSGNYLFNRSLCVDGFWNPNVLTNNDFAHSEDFSYQSNFKAKFGAHPTAEILGFGLILFPKTKAYYKKILKQLGYSISYLLSKDDWHYYDFLSAGCLMWSFKKTKIEEEQAKSLEIKLISEASKHLLDEVFPFAEVLLPVSNLSDDLLKAVNRNLDQIISSRASHGLWDHHMDWQNNKYPEESSASLKWLGRETIKNLFILKHYGRVS